MSIYQRSFAAVATGFVMLAAAQSHADSRPPPNSYCSNGNVGCQLRPSCSEYNGRLVCQTQLTYPRPRTFQPQQTFHTFQSPFQQPRPGQCPPGYQNRDLGGVFGLPGYNCVPFPHPR
jgi:hypothetical protein